MRTRPKFTRVSCIFLAAFAIPAAAVLAEPPAQRASKDKASTQAKTAAIRPFRAEIPEAAIVELRRRVLATRWPDKETVDNQSQGVRLAKIQALVRYTAQRTAEIKVPVGVTVFPGEIYQAPKSWTEKAYPTLNYFNVVDKGGHFAAWEQPELFAREMRAAFKPVRSGEFARR